MEYIKKEQMIANELIKLSREYLNYLEEHIENIRLAFGNLTKACDGMIWVGDDKTWFELRHEITTHDLSKFSKEEFTQYRGKFFPTKGELHDSQLLDMNFDKAWDNHKEKNHHHNESATTEKDIVHMVVDWTAMSYKFGGTAESYYLKNSQDIILSDEHRKFMFEIFSRVKKHSNNN